MAARFSKEAGVFIDPKEDIMLEVGIISPRQWEIYRIFLEAIVKLSEKLDVEYGHCLRTPDEVMEGELMKLGKNCPEGTSINSIIFTQWIRANKSDLN